MNILKEVLKHEVQPAMGCTEPVAVALACSRALLQAIKEAAPGEKITVTKIRVMVNSGVFKNGLGVCIPNTNGQKGLAIAAALGAICGDPSLKLELLKSVEPRHVSEAKKLIETGGVEISVNPEWRSLHIEAEVETNFGQGSAMSQGSHASEDRVYRDALAKMSIAEIVALLERNCRKDYQYIQKGIDMNLALSAAGLKLPKTGSNLELMRRKGFLGNDVVNATKILTAAATDARMAGVNLSAMSSGGSGNQGIVAILVPYNVGIWEKVRSRNILKSIALSHLINAYIKCYVGDLAPVCGCGIAAGAGAAAAIVFQKNQHPEIIGLAIKNVVADIAGLICDGAKGGCSMKVVSATDSAIRSAQFALNNYGFKESDGIVGKTAEETIKNLGRVVTESMSEVDNTILSILNGKTAS